MSELNKHRAVIVRTMIRSLNLYGEARTGGEAFGTRESETQHLQHDWCMVTGLYFFDKLSENQITISNYGPIWMGLWLDDELKLDRDPAYDEPDHKGCSILRTGSDMVLFPRWLAEVINEETSLGIKEEDIY